MRSSHFSSERPDPFAAPSVRRGQPLNILIVPLRYPAAMEEELLHGGVANAGAVVRQGSHVLRPSNRHSESVHRALSALRSTGFLGASNPVGIEAEGRERLEFIDGDVPIPPYPEWARSDEALASVVLLMRGMHDASRPGEPPATGRGWCHLRGIDAYDAGGTSAVRSSKGAAPHDVRDEQLR